MRPFLIAASLLCSVGVAEAAEAPTPDALAARAHQLEQKLAGRHYDVVVEAPFVLIGDEGLPALRRHAKTIHWTRTLLLQDFFSKDPDRVLEVYLFKDEKTYRRGAKELFGDTPDTPFGYYSSDHDALVMNIGPGSGTLVHEIVHPYMEANFPGVPSWFNEGLASLYEYPDEVKGHIRGKVNWRLPSLQKEIRAGKGRTVEAMMRTTTEEFYAAEDQAYGRARYLCYYLQERGLLLDFYKHFRAHAADDPTGIASLKTVLKTDDLAAFEKTYDAYVLGLVQDR